LAENFPGLSATQLFPLLEDIGYNAAEEKGLSFC
jgi:hypothetical protein